MRAARPLPAPPRPQVDEFVTAQTAGLAAAAADHEAAMRALEAKAAKVRAAPRRAAAQRRSARHALATRGAHPHLLAARRRRPQLAHDEERAAARAAELHASASCCGGARGRAPARETFRPHT
jgi:hypothetical protein